MRGSERDSFRHGPEWAVCDRRPQRIKEPESAQPEKYRGGLTTQVSNCNYIKLLCIDTPESPDYNESRPT